MTFTALVKIYCTEYFCITEVVWLGEIFVQRKFLATWYKTTWHVYMYVYRGRIGGGGGILGLLSFTLKRQDKSHC